MIRSAAKNFKDTVIVPSVAEYELFLQMITDSVKVYRPIKKKTYDINTVVDEYGVHPNNFVFYRSLIVIK